MKYQLSPEFCTIFKKLDVRIRNSFWEAIVVFKKNPDDPSLDHKQLKRELWPFWKIDVTKDDKWAAIYELIEQNGEKTAYFIQIEKKEKLYHRS